MNSSPADPKAIWASQMGAMPMPSRWPNSCSTTEMNELSEQPALVEEVSKLQGGSESKAMAPPQGTKSKGTGPEVFASPCEPKSTGNAGDPEAL